MASAPEPGTLCCILPRVMNSFPVYDSRPQKWSASLGLSTGDNTQYVYDIISYDKSVPMTRLVAVVCDSV